MLRLLAFSLALGILLPIGLGCSPAQPKDPEIISMPDQPKTPPPKAPANKPVHKYQ